MSPTRLIWTLRRNGSPPRWSAVPTHLECASITPGHLAIVLASHSIALARFSTAMDHPYNQSASFSSWQPSISIAQAVSSSEKRKLDNAISNAKMPPFNAEKLVVETELSEFLDAPTVPVEVDR